MTRFIKKRSVIICVAQALLVLCLSFTVACDARDPANYPTAQQIHLVQRQGDEIVDGLVVYKNKLVTFPDQLDKIVPDYMPTIKQPQFGTWVYSSLDGGNHFVLKFGGDAAPSTGCPEYWTGSRNLKQWFGY